MIAPHYRNFLFRIAIVSGLVLGIAISLVGMASFESVRLALDKVSGDGSADPYTPLLHQRIQHFTLALGATVISFSICVLVLARTNFGAQFLMRSQYQSKHLRIDGFNLYVDLLQTLKGCLGIGCLSLLIAVITRLPFIQTPIRFDEAISWRDYAMKPIWLTVALYGDPNNHVFHNVLSGLSMKLMGESLVTLRLVSLVSSCAAVVVSAIFTTRLVNKHLSENLGATAGLIAAIGICSHPLWNEFSIYARGYSLMTLLWLLSFISLRHSIQYQNSASWVVSVLLSSLAAWTIPVAIYPVIAICTFLCLEHRAISRVTLWLGCVAALTLVFYSPILVVSGPSAIVGNSYVKALSSSEWISRLPSTLSDYRGPLLWGFHTVLQMFVFMIIATGCIRSNCFLRKIATFIVSLLSVALVVGVQRVLPPERTWLWCVIPISIILSTAIVILSNQAASKIKYSLSLIWIVAAVLFSAPAIQWLSGDTLNKSMAIGPCPEASAAIQFLKEMRYQFEPIVAVCPASGTLDWYAKRAGFEKTAFDPPKKDPLSNRLPSTVIVAVVNNGQFIQTVKEVTEANNSTMPWSNGKATLLWQEKTLAIYRVEKE